MEQNTFLLRQPSEVRVSGWVVIVKVKPITSPFVMMLSGVELSAEPS
jgi:hypothetical protein